MAYKSKNTLFQDGNGATPELFTNVAHLTGVAGPNVTVDPIEATDLDDAAKTFIANVYDGGEVTLELEFMPDDTTHDDLVDKELAGSVDNYQVCFSDVEALAATAVTVSSVNTETDVVTTSAAHYLTTGQPFRFSTTVTLPDGLELLTTYFARRASAETFTAHTTNAGAVANTGKVDIADAGDGTHSVRRGTKWAFAGIVTGVSPTAAINDRLTGSITIKLTASVTIT